VVVIHIKEWRKVSNTYVVIGESRRDFLLTEINSSNKLPQLPNISEKSACTGDTISFDVAVTDGDGDSIRLSWNQAIPGAAFTIIKDTLGSATGGSPGCRLRMM
jgi:hypothetical protein